MDSVKLIISTDGLSLTPDIKDLVQKKLNSKLEKYVKHYSPDAKQATVNLKRESRWGFKATFNSVIPGGKRVHAEEKNKQLFAAITKLSEEVERQLRRIKEKASA